jgi:hypothetical protein
VSSRVKRYSPGPIRTTIGRVVAKRIVDKV